MAGLFARMLSPLRRIDADPDQLVLEAHELLRKADANEGLWVAVSALSTHAQAKIALATYLQAFRPS